MFQKKRVLIFLAAIYSSLSLGAAPPQGGTWNVNDAKTNPVIGSREAKKGGSLVWGAISYPKSLNYIVSGDNASLLIWGLVVETLCEVNSNTGKYVPLLAEKWHLSEDKKVMTFHLNKKARFHSGKPITAKNFKLFWDVVHNKKVLAGSLRTLFDPIAKFEILDDYTLRLTAKGIHFRNLEIACGLFALDDKFYKNSKKFNKAYNNKITGSGPYLVDKVKKGHKVTLKRNKNYWGKDLSQNIGRYNFDKLIYRTVNDQAIRFELFKKGEIDMFEFNVAKRWKTETDGDKFKKNWIIARRGDNDVPRGFSGVILNTRRALFKDPKIRKALAHTYHRERFIKELFYNNYSMLASYFPNSIFAAPGQKPTEFNLKEARKLLQEAGYTKVNDKGILIKDGKPFRFTYLYVGKSSERNLTIWKSDLKKVGIELNLQMITWPSLVKKWETYNFEAAGVAWTGLLNPDPFLLWSSKFKDDKGGNNLTGFATKELDELILSIRPVFDRNERAKIFHKIDKILFENHPYILGWFLNHLRIGYWNKFGFIKGFVPRYTRGDGMLHYVWYDPKKALALEKAIDKGKALPRVPGIKGPMD